MEISFAREPYFGAGVLGRLDGFLFFFFFPSFSFVYDTRLGECYRTEAQCGGVIEHMMDAMDAYGIWDKGNGNVV